MNSRQMAAMDHPDELGAGAEKRRTLPPEERGPVVMAEYHKGTLYSGSGKKVTNEAQAKAIAHDEGHPDGESHPHKAKRMHKKLKH